MTNPATNRGSQPPLSPRYTFRKAERLRRKKILDALFACRTGCLRIKNYPLVWVWRRVDDLPSSYPAQAAFIVGKRRIRKAVQRHRIKRRIRELYRLNKHRLYDALERTNQRGALLVIYVAKAPVTFERLQTAFENGFTRLVRLIETTDALDYSSPHPVLSGGD